LTQGRITPTEGIEFVVATVFTAVGNVVIIPLGTEKVEGLVIGNPTASAANVPESENWMGFRGGRDVIGGRGREDSGGQGVGSGSSAATGTCGTTTGGAGCVDGGGGGATESSTGKLLGLRIILLTGR
jgi:hypothetical protein